MKGIVFDEGSCRFVSTEEENTTEYAINGPLSVIVQVTRRCNFNCIFCSETADMPDPSLADLELIRDNLAGVPRVYLSGGEPMLRRDFLDVARLFHGNHIIGLPTNATVHSLISPDLARMINFVNVGIDGPRRTTSQLRGNYDQIMEGIWLFKESGIRLSLSCVVLASTVEAVPYVCQIADVLNAHKLKLILPVPKGNALQLGDDEYLSVARARELFAHVKDLKESYQWQTKITMTAWTDEVEGYSILAYPNGNAYAWPVYDRPDKVLYLGSLYRESISSIWQRYPYKENHLRKYLGRSIMVA